jgi:amidase
MSDDLWSKDAVVLSDLLRRREITPREVLESVERRVSQVDPLVNALPTLCFDRARRAIAADLNIEDTLLGGLPIPIKDSYAVSGTRTTFGSRAFEHHVPEHSDYFVAAVEQAGGIVFAKSNTPEFEAGANTFNDVFGSTLNPWNPSLSAAGSSGGAAVAVATGMAPIAQGSDFACSLRYPASFCGVVGLRPSPGVVPQGPGGLPGQTLSVIGPLARSVADAGLGLSAMARFDARDPLSRPLSDNDYATAAQRPVAPARLAYSPDLGLAAVEPEIGHIVAAAVQRLEAAGALLTEAHPDLSAADRAFRPLRAYQFAASRSALVRGPERALLKPEVIWNIEEGLRLDGLQLAAAERERAAMRIGMIDFLVEHEFLISPTAPVGPYPVEERYVMKIDGQDMETYLDWLLLGYAITATGCPAISIPCGFTRAGLPVGLQIVGCPYSESRLLAVAAWCEDVLGLRMTRPIDPQRPTVDAVSSCEPAHP